jgi:hypothetical protein
MLITIQSIGVSSFRESVLSLRPQDLDVNSSSYFLCQAPNDLILLALPLQFFVNFVSTTCSRLLYDAQFILAGQVLYPFDD